MKSFNILSRDCGILRGKKIHAFLPYLASIAASILVSILAVRPEPYLIFGAIGLALGIMILINTEISIYVIILSLFSLDWLNRVIEVIPRQITWLPLLIIVILLLKVGFLAQMGAIKFRRSPIDKTIIVIIILSVVSVIVNSVKAGTVLIGLKNSFSFILLFYLLYFLDLDERFYRRIIKIMIILTFLQVPITIYQRMIFSADDLVGGTLGTHTTNVLATFTIGIIGVLVSYYIIRGSLTYIVGICVLMIPIALMQVKGAFLLLPLVFLFLFRRAIFFNLRRSTALVLLVIPILIGSFILSDRIITRVEFGQFFTLDSLLRDTFGKNYRTGNLIGYKPPSGGRLLRGSAIVYAHNMVTSSSTLNALVGFGPGNASESFFSSMTGEYYDEILVPGAHQLPKTILEFGYIGLLLFLLMFYHLYCMNQKFMKNVKDSFWKSISLGYESILFLQIVTIVYIRPWEHEILAFWFWFLSAAILTMRKRKRVGVC